MCSLCARTSVACVFPQRKPRQRHGQREGSDSTLNDDNDSSSPGQCQFCLPPPQKGTGVALTARMIDLFATAELSGEVRRDQPTPDPDAAAFSSLGESVTTALSSYGDDILSARLAPRTEDLEEPAGLAMDSITHTSREDQVVIEFLAEAIPDIWGLENNRELDAFHTHYSLGNYNTNNFLLTPDSDHLLISVGENEAEVHTAPETVDRQRRPSLDPSETPESGYCLDVPSLVADELYVNMPGQAFHSLFTNSSQESIYISKKFNLFCRYSTGPASTKPSWKLARTTNSSI